MEKTLYRIQAAFCQGLAHEKRIRIILALEDSELNVTELAKLLGISLTNTSQHLKILKDIKAVAERKDGNKVYYSISNENITKGCKAIKKAVIEENDKEHELLNTLSKYMDTEKPGSDNI